MEVAKAIADAKMKVGVAHRLRGRPPGRLVLVMAAEPGFGGEKLMPSMMPRVLQLNTRRWTSRLMGSVPQPWTPWPRLA